MTKAEFFKYCDTSTEPLWLITTRIHREPEYAVFLCGLWADGAIVDVQLYQPTPGRQWEVSKYGEAREACYRMQKKFQRWLEAWSKANPTKEIRK